MSSSTHFCVKLMEHAEFAFIVTDRFPYGQPLLKWNTGSGNGHGKTRDWYAPLAYGHTHLWDWDEVPYWIVQSDSEVLCKSSKRRFPLKPVTRVTWAKYVHILCVLRLSHAYIWRSELKWPTAIISTPTFMTLLSSDYGKVLRFLRSFMKWAVLYIAH